MKIKKKCLNCKIKNAGRPRGLFWTCFYLPGVRDKFAPVSIHGTYGASRNESWRSRSPLPPEPTLAPPGSEEKQAVMQERASKGYSLFHPLDADFSGQTSYKAEKGRPRQFLKVFKEDSDAA